MRRNQSVNWRALAMLGALLSITIDWPPVFAMPSILATLSTSAPALVSLTLTTKSTKEKRRIDINNYISNNNNSLNNNLSYTFNSYNANNNFNNNSNKFNTTTTFNNVFKTNFNYNSNNNNINGNSSKVKSFHNWRFLRTRTFSKLSESENENENENQDENLNQITTDIKASTNIDESFDNLLTTTTTSTTTTINSYSNSNNNNNNNNKNINNNDNKTIGNTIILLSRTDRSVRNNTYSHDHHHKPNSRSDDDAALENNLADSTRKERNSSNTKSMRLSNNNNNNNNNHNNNDSYNPTNNNVNSSNLDRNERSTISHLSGPARKIQLYIKNRFIQLLPDGIINGTQDDQSDYTILQRTTVDVGQIKIQGVATCLYLCMDQCGAVYGSKEFSDDCVFNEFMEQHNYNTYSSTYNSNPRRIYYLALNRHGEPRKLQIPSSRSLGKLATYTKAITETVPQDRVEKLIAKKFGSNRVKHGIRQLCDTGKPLVELTDKILKPRPKCNPINNNNKNNSNNIDNNHNHNNISINQSNSNNQLLNNVPAANDKSKISSNSNFNASSSHSNNLNDSNTNNNNSSNNNHHNSNQIVKKKKKKRKCRPHESEVTHGCQRSPQLLKKRPPSTDVDGVSTTRPKCRTKASGGMECTPPKQGKKNFSNTNANANNNNNNNNKKQKPLKNSNQRHSSDQIANNHRRSKKLNGNGKQSHSGERGNIKNAKGGGGGGNRKREKLNKNGADRKALIKPLSTIKNINKKNHRQKQFTSTKIQSSFETTTAMQLLATATTLIPYPDGVNSSFGTKSNSNSNNNNNEHKRDIQTRINFSSSEDQDYINTSNKPVGTTESGNMANSDFIDFDSSSNSEFDQEYISSTTPRINSQTHLISNAGAGSGSGSGSSSSDDNFYGDQFGV